MGIRESNNEPKIIAPGCLFAVAVPIVLIIGGLAVIDLIEWFLR